MTLKIDQSLFEPWRRGGPGGVAALLQDGEVVFALGEGRADLATGAHFTPDTPFHICSCTKQYTAVALLMLEAQGCLSLDDDIHRHVSGLADFGAPITLRHLVTNTSGLRDYLQLPALATGRAGRVLNEQMTRELIFGQRTTMFAPGSAFRYSNTNFALLGWTIEQVTGRPLAEIFDELIFAPLGMTKTRFLIQSNPGPTDGATGYEGRSEADFHAPNLEIYEAGDGGVWSTLNDLVRWEQNLLTARVGSAALFARLAEPTRLNDGRSSWYGLGHGTGTHRGTRWFGHAGGLSGMTVNRAHFPDRRISAIAAGNSGLLDAETLTFAMADSLLGSAEAPKPVLAMPEPADIAALTGVYQTAGGAITAIFEALPDGVQLRVHRATARLWRDADGQFVDEGGWFRVALDGDGRSLTIGRGAATMPLHAALPAARTQDFAGLEGQYRSGELRATYTIEPRGGALWVAIEGPWNRSGEAPLMRLARDVFEIGAPDGRGGLRPGGVPVTFVREGDRAVSLTVSAQGAENIRFERIGA
jgi:CubicO group peptidase (beta-lactamase class C family)